MIENGTVKTWLQDRGFGFLTDEAGLDVFVHANQLPESVRRGGAPLLTQGQKVRFRRLADPRGPKAFDVTVAGDPDVLTEAQFMAELSETHVLTDSADRERLLSMAREHGWAR